MLGLDQTCTVYTPNATAGTYTVVAKTGLACRLALAGAGAFAFATDNAPEREVLTGRRILLWDASYTMPTNAQVEVDGIRWSLVEDSRAYPRLPNGSASHGRAEVVRA